jgi:thiosulfate dehydrogenase
MKTRTFFLVFAGMWMTFTNFSTFVNAGDVDFSNTEVIPVNETTLRVYELKYAPTPDVSYNVDFVFREEYLTFEPDMNSLKIADLTKYSEADMVRGGLFYDKWWKINAETEPTDTFSRYPAEGSQAGSTTWRCKECHGWDYKGKEGAYEGGDHYTGIRGSYDFKNGSEERIYDRITAKNLPLSEQDVWDLTKFIKEGLIEMNKYIIFTGTQAKSATGDAGNGRLLYESSGRCVECHGEDGNKKSGVSVGFVADEDPWKCLHKIRFGQPATQMPSAVKNGLSVQYQVDILTYAQTLPGK